MKFTKSADSDKYGYNGYNIGFDNSFKYANEVKIYQYKDSKIKPVTACLGNISKDFTVDNIKNIIKWMCIILF